MSEPAPGDRIAKDLVLIKPLIQGGMGTVWAAKHEGLRSEVAVKILAGNLADDETSRERFAREAASAMSVQSPHVVQMLDYGVSDKGNPYIVMELLNGRDLEATLAENGASLPARDVVSIVTQVGQALHRAHENNIVHRDIKPANVFLMKSDGFTGDKYLVKLLDFGFAKKVDRLTAQLTQEGMIVGTPQYMSPEQMTGSKLDPRSDLFSLGAVAFEAFTGKRAFAGETLRQIADSIENKPLPRPSQVKPGLPAALDDWFAKACARDRERRFANAREMVQQLQTVFASEGPTSAMESAPHARAEGKKSSSAWIWVLLLLAAGGAAAYWFTLHPPH